MWGFCVLSNRAKPARLWNWLQDEDLAFFLAAGTVQVTWWELLVGRLAEDIAMPVIKGFGLNRFARKRIRHLGLGNSNDSRGLGQVLGRLGFILQKKGPAPNTKP